MAFSYVNERGDYDAKGASATTAVDVTADIAAGQLLAVILVTDNASTSSGNTNDHTGMADDQGNSYTKVYEYTQASGVATDGVTTSLWFSELTTGLTTGASDSVTGTHTSVVARAIGLWEFSTSGSVALEDAAGANGSH